MMAESRKQGSNDSKGPTDVKETQARVDRATVVLALAEEPGDFGPCLSDEELAIFASEGGSRKETARWLRHAGHCPTCREQWLLVKQSLEQGQERSKLYRLSIFCSVQSLRSVGLALAAAACVAVYLHIVEAPGPMQENLPVAPTQTVESGPPLPPAVQPPPGPKPKNVAPGVPAAPATRVTSPAPLPEPTAAPNTPGKRTSSSAASVEREAVPPSSQGGGQPGPKALGGLQKGVETQSLQEEASTARDSLEKDEANRRSPEEVVPPEEVTDKTETEEVAEWLSALRRACETHQADGRVWEDLVRRGEGLSGVTARYAEPALAAILSLVRDIGEIDDAKTQCPRILAAIEAQGVATEGGKKRAPPSSPRQ